MGFFSFLFKKRKPKKLKLGIALGSGGAKGFAHIGVLKAFEENGIEFDIVAGTSIGSVVGAFYSDGYSATDIIQLLERVVDLGDIKSLFMKGVDSLGIFSVVEREIGALDIEQLKKPFKAVATHLESGDEKVFDSGSVTKALCASSSIPPLFKPVVIDGERYVDGAYSNALPADLVKQMGADYVVGIDLSTKESKQGVLSKLFPSYKAKVENPYEKGYANSDVILHPDLNDFNSYMFWEGAKMYDIGYHHALSFIPKIKQDIENLKKKKGIK